MLIITTKNNIQFSIQTYAYTRTNILGAAVVVVVVVTEHQQQK